MKRYPGTFSDAMIRAILDGTKTQDRRAIKLPDSIGSEYGGSAWAIAEAPRASRLNEWAFIGQSHPTDYPWIVKCPFGKPGDRFWVVECWQNVLSKVHVTGDPDDHGGKNDPCWGYRATMTYTCGKTVPSSSLHQWRSSMCMPRTASRITVEIIDMRVERVRDIDTGAIAAEGVDNGKSNPTMGRRHDAMQRIVFRELWDSLNAKRGYGWDANPWVWVPEFEVSNG